MRKFFLLILTLALSHGAFAQADGDFRTKATDASYIFWGTASNWEVYNSTSGTWDAASDAPGKGGNDISTHVTVTELTIMLNEEITVTSTGSITISDDGSGGNFFLYLGYNSDYASTIYLYGEIIIENSADTQLNIQDLSKLYIQAGGKITDNSTSGNIKNGNASGGIIIYSSNTSGQENGSLVTQTASLNGTVYQYISSGQWHLISSPISSTTVNDFWNGSDNAYMRAYNFGWGSYITDVNTSLNVGQGYEVWETKSGGYNVITSGTFNTGSQTLSVTSGGSGADTDWNSIGNPFPCGLDWNAVSDKTNVYGSTFYVWNGSSWDSSNGVSGTANSIIPPFQGFFVEYLSGDVTVNDGDKVHPGSGNDLNKSSNADYSNHIKIEANFNGQKSNTFCYQQSEATNGNDLIYDAPKLFGNSNLMEVYTLAGDKKSDINIYGEYPYVMEVGFKVPDGGGEITIRPTDFRHMEANLSVYLQDKETGAYFDFLANPTYTFTASVGDVSDRIYLIFNNTVATNNLDQDKISIYSNKSSIYLNFNNQKFNGELKVYNLLGQIVYSTKTSNSSYNPIYLNQPSGYYLVELITEKKNLTQKVFIQQ